MPGIDPNALHRLVNSVIVWGYLSLCLYFINAEASHREVNYPVQDHTESKPELR